MKCLVGAATVALIASASAAYAQSSTHISVAATTAFPIGQFSENYSPGPGVTVALTGGANDSPIGYRLDVSDVRLRGRTVNGVQYNNLHMTAATLSAVGAISVGYTKPYLMLGAGWYPFRKGEPAKRISDWGITSGLGITFPFPVGAAFLEARYHYIYGRSTAQRYLPVSFGVTL